MGPCAPRDWTEQHDGPPPLADAQVLVLPDRRLLWRAGMQTGVVGALVIWGGWFSTARVGTFVGGIIVIAVSAARTRLWARGFVTRRVISTPIHLVVCRRDVPEQWVAWLALDRLAAHRGPWLPEWSRNGGMWFFVAPEPALAILPPRAFIGGFGEMLIPHRATEAGIEWLRAEANSRHVTIEVR